MTQKILLVDDDPKLRRLVSVTLGKDYELIEASNGHQALEVSRREMPALILLDVRMPGLDGFEVCRRLKKDDATSSIKVVLLTGLGADEERALGEQAGADGYFTKPFSPRALKSRVAELLE